MPQVQNIRGGHATATIEGIDDLVLEGNVVIDNTRVKLTKMGNAQSEIPQLVIMRNAPEFTFQLVNPRNKVFLQGETLQNFTMTFDFDNGETFTARNCYDISASHKVDATQGTVESMTITYNPRNSSWG